MPTYDYRCEACKQELVKFQRITEDAIKDCPECGKPALRRLIGSGSGIIFKGSGFYETDYKRSRNGDGSKKDSKSESKTESKSESKKSETKSDSSSSSSSSSSDSKKSE